MPKPVGVKDECPKGRDAPAARLATAALEEAHLETVSTGLLASAQAFDVPKSTAQRYPLTIIGARTRSDPGVGSQELALYRVATSVAGLVEASADLGRLVSN